MDQQRPWATREAVALGERVAFYRERRKLSAQELAALCAGRGMPSITRTVITKLENGRRESVSTAELQVLAKALDVPPLLLLFPVGHAESVEVLPGVTADPWHAAEWFTGQTGDPSDPSAPPQLGALSPVVLWPEHERCDGIIPVLRRELDDARDGVPTRAQLRELATTARSLLRVRELIFGAGMIPPKLHPETARVLAAAGHRDPWAGAPYPEAADYWPGTACAADDSEEASDGAR